MKIPYGLSNFRDVIIEGYLNIDKTAYIAKLEEQGKLKNLIKKKDLTGMILSVSSCTWDS